MARRASTRPSLSPDEARYRAQEDLRTLTSSLEIQSDRRRLSAAHKYGREQMKTLAATTQMAMRTAGGGRKTRGGK